MSAGYARYHLLTRTHSPTAFDVESRVFIRLSAQDAEIISTGEMDSDPFSPSNHGSRDEYDELCRQLDERVNSCSLPTPAGNTSQRRFKVVLMTAQGCNMQCQYCFQGTLTQTTERMSPSVATRAVEFFCRSYETNELVFFFFGGEPLLNWPAIKAGVEAAIDWCKHRQLQPPSFSIQTNATLLNESHASFLKRHNFAVTVSLDGPPEVNDAVRIVRGSSSSYRRICAGIEHLKQAEIPFTVEATITRRHIQQRVTVKQVLDHMHDLGATGAHIMPVIRAPADLALTSPHLAHAVTQFSAVARHCIETAMTNEPRRLQYVSYILDNIRSQGQRHLCFAGTGTVTVTPQGHIYPCYYLETQALSMGTIHDTEPSPQYINVFNYLRGTTKLDLDPCQRCWAQTLCSSCYGAASGISAPERGLCLIQRAMIDAVLSSLADQATTIQVCR